METLTERFRFRNERGIELAALLDRPEGDYRGKALFAHCFTCSKDIHSAATISQRLVARGWVTLRFDFTGLGESGGAFEETNFTTTVQDLVDAARQLDRLHSGPFLLLGHSWGGTATLAAASQITDVRAVATLNAPYDPAHVRSLLGDAPAAADRDGTAEVRIGGRSFHITRQFLRDLETHPMQHRLSSLGCPLLVLHSPSDDVVDIENASLIFQNARHPKSFISLNGMDHLLSDRAHREYVGELVAAWCVRYF